jgi:hypothetical protein
MQIKGISSQKAVEKKGGEKQIYAAKLWTESTIMNKQTSKQTA